MSACTAHKTGEVPHEPSFSIHSAANDYELDADGVRMFAAVLLRQLERITGSVDTSPQTAHHAAAIRLYACQPVG